MTNPDSQTATHPDGFTFVDASTFDFNGDWEGSAYFDAFPEHVLFRMKVRDNVVVSVVCAKDEEIVFSPAPQVKQGRFTFTGAGGATMTGVILGPGYAEGAISIAPCLAAGWDALKKN